ncbi:MAG: hypothetical protein Q7R85_01435 [bacterium]|nr:hypothetical protein [bacterium]
MNIWLAAHKREMILVTLVVLISTISFASGYLFARDAEKTPIVITQ